MAKKINTQTQSPQRRRAPAAGSGAGAAGRRQQPQPDAQNQTLVDSVGEVLDEMLGPVIEQQQALSDRLDELARPVDTRDRQGNLVTPATFGGTSRNRGRSAAVHSGERAGTSRGFSYLRAIGVACGLIEPEMAKTEMAMAEDLRAMFGGLERSAATSFFVPLGSRHLNFDEAFADEVREMTAQSIAGADPEEMRRIGQTRRQTMGTDDLTAGGSLIDLPQSGELIELVRAKECMPQAGARELTLPPSGRYRLPRQTGASTGYWVGESTTITESQPQTGDLTLIAKKVAGLVRSSSEMFRFATASYEAFLRQDLAAVLALKADEASLTGIGGTSIKGLLNYTGLTDLTGNASYVTAATDGDTLLPTAPSLMLGELEDLNFDAMNASFLIRPKLWRAILNKRAGAAADDDLGQFLYSVNRSEISKGVPAALEGAKVVRSTQVPKDRAKGSGTNLTALICGDFSQWVIGRAGVLEIVANPFSDTAFAQDEILVRAIQHIDAGPRHEEAFVLIDDLLETTV